MAKRKNYPRVIITDDKGKPMAWSRNDRQLCYCTDDRWQDEHFPVKSYSKAVARIHIKASLKERQFSNLSLTEYKTMPFAG